MRKRLSLIMAIVCFTIAALTIGGMIQMANAAEPTKIIGKATIKAGTTLGGAINLGNGWSAFQFVAFEDQDVYITLRVEAITAADGTPIPSGYLLDASGFKHSCPAHGLESMDGGIIGLPDSQIADFKIKIELF